MNPPPPIRGRSRRGGPGGPGPPALLIAIVLLAVLSGASNLRPAGLASAHAEPLPGPSARASAAAWTGPAPVADPAPRAPGWSAIAMTGAGPSPRAGAQLAFDAADGYLVLYGGENASSVGTVCGAGCATDYAQTWIGTGSGWRALNTTEPPARSGESMTYDAADGYVLLFGGQLACATPPCPVSGDTWAFRGGRWSEIATSGPAPRFDAAMTYDAGDGYVLLFGGELANGTVTNTTWRYAGGAWSPVPAGGPAPDPYITSMTYDPADGYVLLLGTSGATTGGNPANVTWTYRGGIWTEAPTTGNLPFLWGAWLGYDPAAGYIVLLGQQVFGSQGALVNATWGYLGGSWFPVATRNPPLALGLSTLAYDPLDGALYTFGGEFWPNGTQAGGLSNETWRFSAPPVGLAMSITAAPPVVCATTAPGCNAGTNTTALTIQVTAVYVPSPAEFAGRTAPLFGGLELMFVPWGSVRLPATRAALGAEVACTDPSGFLLGCDPAPSYVVEPNGQLGLALAWSTDLARDQMLPGASWMLTFNVTVAAPPFGTVPVDACVTAECTVLGSGTIGKNYSAIRFSPYDNGSVETDPMPDGLLSVEPPSTATSPGAISGPPPPPEPIPPPPTTAPIPIPPATTSSPPPSTPPGLPAFSPVATGLIAAGMTRISLRRKVSMAVAAPAGLARGPGKRSGPPPPPVSRFGE